MDKLTRTAEDYLKVIWSAGEWGGSPPTTKALAERFGTSPATVSDTIKRLSAHGLIVHEPYKAIALTRQGELHALQMVRRHRLIETFLVTSLGYTWDEVHDEAESLEHSASDLMIDRIDELLGNPECDPHGDPIPSRTGTIVYPPDAITLTQAEPGHYRITRVSDADPSRLAYFRERGLAPGAAIDVTVRDEHARTWLVDTPNGRHIALAPPITDAIVLVPERG